LRITALDVDARNKPAGFEPRQHKVFAERNLAGLTAAQDEKIILMITMSFRRCLASIAICPARCVRAQCG
jgi:hypothetical protein